MILSVLSDFHDLMIIFNKNLRIKISSRKKLWLIFWSLIIISNYQYFNIILYIKNIEWLSNPISIEIAIKCCPKNQQGLEILTDGSGLLMACTSLTGLQPSVTILRLLVVWRRFPSDRWERRLVWARKYELSTRTGLTVDQWELHRHWKILDLPVKKDRGSIL